MIQASHLGGEEDRLIAIPSMVCFLAMSMIVLKLQWPRQQCQVLTFGTWDAWKVLIGAVSLGMSLEGDVVVFSLLHMCVVSALDMDR